MQCQYRRDADKRKEITHRSVGRECSDENIVEDDILGVDEEVGPARRVQLSNSLDRYAGSVVCQEENWAVVVIIVVLHTYQQETSFSSALFTYQNLPPSKVIVPLLSITVHSTLPKDLDILTTPNPEG